MKLSDAIQQTMEAMKQVPDSVIKQALTGPDPYECQRESDQMLSKALEQKKLKDLKNGLWT